MTARTFSRGDAFIPADHFVECLQRLAADRPHDTALVVVQEQGGEAVEIRYDYRTFEQQVRAVAAELQQRFEPGDRALVLSDNDGHYAVGMFACFYAGVIAVPAFPPESTRPQHLARLAGIASDARARGILTRADIKALVGGVAEGFGLSTVIAVDAIDAARAGEWRPHAPAAADVAFLQYTSGSTSAPKGVMVTHGNLMANQRAIREGMAIGPRDKLGVWSPLFHDMGLIGGLLQPFYSGIPCVLTSPRFFLERPVRWLELISRHGVTISGGPDFAYRLCLERIKEAQLEGLDLSSWRVAYTGAEPVRHDTMAAFIERYAAVGFSPGAVYPCYGLAEATLFVTGGRSGAGMTTQRFAADALAQRLAVPAAEGAALVGCGGAPSGHAVRIVDPHSGEIAAAGAIGEIWAAGPSIAAGYWNQPEATAAAFVERDGQRWLRTGDLGFESDGALFVAGRLKDMIIVRGHNLYPQDIERLVEAEVEAVRKGRVAAFAVTDANGEEGFGVAAEVSHGMQKLVATNTLVEVLGAAVAMQCGEAPRVIVLLNPGALPKTSSGKLQRSACRRGWMERTLDAYAVFENGRAVSGGGDGTDESTTAAASGERTQALIALWRETLGHGATNTYPADAHFFALGGNSLGAARLAAQIALRWGIDFSPRDIFETPRLREQARAIDARLAAGARRSVMPVLPAAQRGEPWPLSPAQQRQWFLWQLDPQGAAYHVQGALRITGALDADRLRQALDGLVRRHESLRTIFRARSDGAVEQLVRAEAALPLQLIDLCADEPGVAEARAAERLRAFGEQPFDLTQGPLARALLIRLAGQVQLLALSMHHIIADAASMQILLDELASRYGGAGAVPAGASVDYIDYVAWQQQPPQREARQRQLAYWRDQLAVAPEQAQPVLLLPTDFPRPAVVRYRAARFGFELPMDLLRMLRQRGEAEGATLFTLLLAGFQALLYRYTAQRDVRIGVPVANRGSAELLGVVGFFVNTLVLRNVMHGRMNLAQVLAQAQAAVAGAQANQDLPFEALVEALRPERSLSHSPLFQVLFNHLREDYRALQALPGLAVASEPIAGGDAQFDLSVELRERPDGSMGVQLVYAADLFEPQTMARLARHYSAMLEALALTPAAAVGDVELLTTGERAELTAWSRNGERLGGGEIVHHRFEQQVRRTPQATALCFGEQSFTFDELNRRANRLAHRLIAAGVGPDQPVGIAMERSLAMVVGLLAILKAGGAYVPIEPEYPAERIGYMLADSGVELLLTQSHLRAALALPATVAALAVDALQLDAEPEHDPAVPLHGENLVYIIYTSGSTGRPKAAANRHRALCNRLAWGQHHQPLNADDTVLQKTPFSFDISFWEFFWPLTTGARLVLAGPGEHRDPQRLVALIDRHSITTIHFVPSMLHAFLGYPGTGGCASLRRIVCSGEALPADLQAQTLAAFPQASLLNLYGPTEAAIEVTGWDCRDDGRLTVPIGRPLAGLCAHVLDDNLNEVPRGVAGELYLGGIGLARCYWRRPALTAERFVADPAGDGGRLYRTGDLVRWRMDGELEYLGRIDHQIKIRGFRIELGEVEAQLRAQPEVGEAVVVAHDGPGGTRLIAYISLREAEVALNRVKAALAAALPDYMLPAVIMVLERLPLNSNGKVDRKALPAPEPVERPPYAAPEGAVGAALAAIWSEVLGIERVGAADNFFDLGGHSLQLIRVHRLLEDRLHTGVSVVDLFKYPTVGALARRIEQGAEPETQTASTADDDRRRASLLQRKRRMERIG